MKNRSSKNTKLRYVFYMLLACVISYFCGYRHSNYTTVKYIENRYPTISNALDDINEGDTVIVYYNYISWPNAR